MSTAVAQALAIFGAGAAAGTINAVVGSGTLITFPTLLAFGYAPVLANVSNNVGLVPGGFSGVHGYRAELAGQRDRVLRLGAASVCGGLTGAILLLVLPASAFKAIVPALIAIALVMVVLQPSLARRVAARQRSREVPQAAATRVAVGHGPDESPPPPAYPAARASEAAARTASGGPLVWVLVFCSSVYGGYFGAAQGVLLIGLLGIALGDTLQRINAVKNVLAAGVNTVAAVVFIAVTHIDWSVAALIAAGSIIGGQIGARVGRHLPPWGLRVLILCVGIAALVKLLA